MSTVRDKAYEVQEAAAAAALREIDAEDDNVLEDTWDTLSRGEDYLHYDWPADPYDTDLIDDIPDAFAWLSYREADGLAAKRAAVERGQSVLSAAQGRFFRLKSLLYDDSKFDGATVNAFVDYLDTVKDAATAQAELADELAFAVECMQSLLGAAETDVIDIADKSIAAFDAIHKSDPPGDSTMFYTVAGILLGVAGTVATGGTATALTFALVSGSLSIAASAGGTTEYSPATDVLSQILIMEGELLTRKQKFEDHEDEIVRGLNLDLAAVDGSGAHDILDSLNPRPGGLVKGRGDFHATGATLADLKELYDLATGDVPDLAEDFSTATRDFEDANGTEVLAMGDTSSPWEDLLDILQRLSAKASDALYDGGTVLAKAAQDFARQDGGNAKWINSSVAGDMERKDPVFPAPDPVGPPYYPGHGGDTG